MEPIPETVEAVNELDPSADGTDLLDTLHSLASRAQTIVPDLVGVSVAMVHEGLTFTLVASAEQVAVLDAVQYAVGGPCVDASEGVQTKEPEEADILDEERWRLFAEASAARTVRSTLTLPILDEDRVVGTVNLYGASRRAFTGHHEALAEVFGAWAAGAVVNADLSFTTRTEAQAAPDRVKEQAIVDLAVGILAAELALDPDGANERLRSAAARAGVSAVQLARYIVRARYGRATGEP